MNFECRSADILNYDCDVEKKCHGHGVRQRSIPPVCSPVCPPLLTCVCLEGV